MTWTKGKRADLNSSNTSAATVFFPAQTRLLLFTPGTNSARGFRNSATVTRSCSASSQSSRRALRFAVEGRGDDSLLARLRRARRVALMRPRILVRRGDAQFRHREHPRPFNCRKSTPRRMSVAIPCATCSLIPRVSIFGRRNTACLEREQSVDAEHESRMNLVNPKYVLRNYMALKAIADATEKRDYAEIDRLLALLSRHFDGQPESETYAASSPDLGKRLVVSCSS